MKNSLKEVLILLNGGLFSGKVASDAIVDIIEECDVPETIHFIVTVLLCNNREITRYNSSHALKLISKSYIGYLLDLINYSESDGELLKLKDVNISKIIESGVELYSKEDESWIIDDIYSENWIKKQRAALRKQLGQESNSCDDSLATQYISVKNMIKKSDVKVKETKHSNKIQQLSQNNLQSSISFTTTNSSLNSNSSSNTIINNSNETWFIRILRYLIANILHPKWEHRHGSFVGLISILEGINLLDKEIISTITTSTTSTSSLLLPIFLIEDIITTCISVLVMERYLDVNGNRSFDLHNNNNNIDYNLDNENIENENYNNITTNTTNTTTTTIDMLFVSPVKESASRLISLVCTFLNVDVDANLNVNTHKNTNNNNEFGRECFLKVINIFSFISQNNLTSTSIEWSLTHSGFITIKHLFKKYQCVESIIKIERNKNINKQTNITNSQNYHQLINLISRNLNK